MKRRTLLGLGAGLGVSFVLAGCLPVIPKRPDASLDAAVGWVRHEGGRYFLSLPRAEIGQNISTALKQIACEELAIGWDDLELQLPTSNEIELVRATVGSDSVKDFAIPLAQACATLRDALAAGQTAGEISARERPVSKLRAFAAGTRFVGKDVPLVQAHAIVTGASVYASDVRRPGMAFGRVLRAPLSPELSSSPATWNAAAARAVPGFVAIVEDSRLAQMASMGLGIVAETPGALDRIAEALQVKWQSEDDFDQAGLDKSIDIDKRLGKGELSYQLADDGLDREGPWDVDLRIDIPLAAHAPMEPRAAVAEFSDDGMQLWTGSQDAFYARDVMASKFKLDKAAVTTHNMRVGGAFGGKTICTVELEAAVLARHAGRPVKVQWTRAQEFQQGFHRSPSSHRLRARLENGKLTDWWHGFASGHSIFTNAAFPPWMQKFTDIVGDKGVARGALPPYRIPRRRIEHDLIRLPVLTGPWRGLGAGPNCLLIESAMDESARKAGLDPVDFRLAHIEEPRLAIVLRRVAKMAGTPAKVPGVRAGRGVACGIYKEMSYAAVVADVLVDEEGNVNVTRLWCAHDCGRAINPDQVRAQCEGNLVWGLAMVLSDDLPVADGGIDAATFSDAPIPRFDRIPAMDIDVVDQGQAPSGAGETAIVAAAGAILNAIRDATGIRPSRLPVLPDHLVG